MFPYIVEVLIEYDTLWSYVNHALIFAINKDEAITKTNECMITAPFSNQKGYHILDCTPFLSGKSSQYPQWIYNFSELVNSPKYN